MKVFITGGNGFVGSHLVDKLLEKNYDVHCLVRSSSDLTWLKNKKVTLVNGSLDNVEHLSDILKDFDYIYHVAGLVAAKNYNEFLKANKIGTLNLLDAVLKSSQNLKKFILVSSLAAAGPSKSIKSPKTEKDECNPITSYGKSKREGELAALNYLDKLPITIVRPPAVYGERDKAIFSVFKIASKGLGTVIGYNDKRVSLIHVSDLVDGIILAGESDVSSGQTYFITSEEFYSWNQLIPLIGKSLGKANILTIKLPHLLVYTLGFISGQFGKLSKKPPVFDFEKAIDFTQQYWICSPEKSIKELGYKQKINIEEGINNTSKWYKQMKWL